MFIETAVKNVALECILKEANSENIPAMYDKVVCGYHNCPNGSTQNEKKKAQEMKLKLENNTTNWGMRFRMHTWGVEEIRLPFILKIINVLKTNNIFLKLFRYCFVKVQQIMICICTNCSGNQAEILKKAVSDYQRRFAANFDLSLCDI